MPFLVGRQLVILILWFLHLFCCLSNNIPALLAKVMPLSLLHFPFVPFPLYSLLISLCCHCCGICSSLYIVFGISRHIHLVCSSASMNASFGIRSGPLLLFLFSFFIQVFSSSLLIGFSFCDYSLLLDMLLTVSLICLVHGS